MRRIASIVLGAHVTVAGVSTGKTGDQTRTMGACGCDWSTAILSEIWAHETVTGVQQAIWGDIGAIPHGTMRI